jgi:putative pyruvate formate lyase activating enzyme
MSLSALETLRTYFAVINGERFPKYLLSKSVGVDIELNAPIERLWEVHDRATTSSSEYGGDHDQVFPSLLSLKLELARRNLFKCELCERMCAVDRAAKIGYCGVSNSKVASKFVHWGEEPELVPSYTIFFSGCTFKCIFCQNWDISQSNAGSRIEPEQLASDIQRRFGPIRNVNWVGGEPTPNLPYIIEVLDSCSATIPQVWNSNMYMTEDCMKLLDGIIDLFLTDFKYGNDRCAHRLSGAKDYFSVVARNHLLASKQCELIIRHLVMPGHIECCTKPVLDWISEKLDSNRVRVNVMDQYRPEYNADRAEELKSPLGRKEFLKAYEYAESLGLNLVD